MKISEKVKKLRKDLKMTQGTFAESIGITQKTLSFWEKGINIPKEENLLIICNKFDLDKEYFSKNDVINFDDDELFLNIKEKFKIPDSDIEFIKSILSSQPERSLHIIFKKAINGNADAVEICKSLLNDPKLVNVFLNK